MERYVSVDPMKNFYKIDAFRFKYGLDGIDSSTNVMIQVSKLALISMQKLRLNIKCKYETTL